MNKNFDYIKDNIYIFILIILMVFTILILPVLINPFPFGTDSFGHIHYSNELKNTEDINQYQNEFLTQYGYENIYPLGMHTFYAILSNITGLDVQSDIIQIILIILIFLSFYYYFRSYNLNYSLFPILFVLISPMFMMRVVSLVSNIFILPILLILVSKIFSKKISFPDILIIIILSISLIFFHTGSTLFLFFTILIYMILISLFKYKIQYYIKPFLFVILLPLTLFFFENIQNMYLRRFSLFSKIIKTFYDKYNITFLEYFFDFFKSVFSILFIVCIIIIFCIILNIFMRNISYFNFSFFKARHFSFSFKFFFFIIFLFLIIHSFFQSGLIRDNLFRNILEIGCMGIIAIFGLKFKDRNILLYLSILIVCIANLIHDDSGQVRYLFYLILILPILATSGYQLLVKKISEFNIPNFLVHSSFFIFCLFFTLFISLYNVNFLPQYGIDNQEIELLGYIDRLDNQNVVLAPNYKERIELYSDSINLYNILIKSKITNDSSINDYYRERNSNLNYDQSFYTIDSYRAVKKYNLYNEKMDTNNVLIFNSNNLQDEKINLYYNLNQ
jgi:hypothetical protein